MRLALVLLVVLLVAVVGFWGVRENSAPAKTLEHGPDGYDEVHQALVGGNDIIVDQPLVNNAGVRVRDLDTVAPRSNSSSHVSYGELTPRQKDKLLGHMQGQLKHFEDKVESLGEPEGCDQMIEWHFASYEAARARAFMDQVVIDQAFVADRLVHIIGYDSAAHSIGEVWIDEDTGLNVEPRDNPTKEYLRLQPENAASAPVAVTLASFRKYPQLEYHQSEMQRLRREAAAMRVVQFNAYDYLERKRRHDEHELLRSKLRAMARRTPEIREDYSNRMDALIPSGIKTNPANQYFATPLAGWQ